MPLDRVCVGVITGAHGIRGEVKLKSFTENPLDIASYGTLENEDGSRQFNIKLFGKPSKTIRASIEGVTDRNMAEELKGEELYINRSLLGQADEEEFYHADLIGLDATLEDGSVVGKVVAVYDYGAGDFLEVKTSDGKPAVIPFTKRAVPVIDVKGGKIEVKQEALVIDTGKKDAEPSADAENGKEI
jgi:16S rRNA processing protein RimM